MRARFDARASHPGLGVRFEPSPRLRPRGCASTRRPSASRPANTPLSACRPPRRPGWVRCPCRRRPPRRRRPRGSGSGSCIPAPTSRAICPSSRASSRRVAPKRSTRVSCQPACLAHLRTRPRSCDPLRCFLSLPRTRRRRRPLSCRTRRRRGTLRRLHRRAGRRGDDRRSSPGRSRVRPVTWAAGCYPRRTRAPTNERWTRAPRTARGESRAPRG